MGILVGNDEHTAHGHERLIGIENVDHLNGLFGSHTLGDVDEQAVLRQQRVECHLRFSEVGERTQILLEHFGMTLLCLDKRLDHHGVIRIHASRAARHEDVVVEEIEAGAQVGHIATEGARLIGGKCHTVQVHAIVGGKDCLQVCRLIVLGSALGQHGSLQSGKRVGAQGIESSRCMAVEVGTVRVIEVDILLKCAHDGQSSGCISLIQS